ncbi:MAG: hypothetical protein E6Q97_16350 [Desulfurellales bacterium]|nr:MAG: hypothetical protein E6Q97_16350 [Desulfurellales bacterium]
MTDAGQLDAEKWLRHENADVRAEFIRKYGIERLKTRGKVVDDWRKYDEPWFEKSEYELVDMSPVFTRIPYAPYLSMRNQSVPGVWHMEAVPRTVKTVQEAVEFRTKTKNPKIVNIK